MDKTININLGGILFQIDEDAFRILRDYLQSINNRFGSTQGGNETIEDIESRIAEIFQSQRGLAGAITKENVESMITIIGKPEEFDHGQEETVTPSFPPKKKRMYRNTDDTIIGGVCSGIAVYLDTDPVLFRILFVLFGLFFGAGFLVYLGLWIALPASRTEAQKLEMYGSAYHQHKEMGTASKMKSGYNSPSRIGNAIDEIFRAIGKVIYMIVRIFLVIIGVAFVITGFLFILTYVMIFVFKFPGVFSSDFAGVSLVNIPDFLHYIVNPSSVPWIIILTSVAVILPMLAIIYWGVKMIFWFRVRDGIVSLVALVVWVMAVATLAIIGFNEGVSFAEMGNSRAQNVLPHSPDTLYIISDKKIADLKFEKEISLPHEEYTVFINDGKKELYIRPYMGVERSDDKTMSIELKKQSAGRTESEAIRKSEELLYSYNITGDTLHVDEYFTLPAGRKWAGDNVDIKLYVPAGTIIKFERNPKILLHSTFRNQSEEYFESRWAADNDSWIMTDDGLESSTESTYKHK